MITERNLAFRNDILNSFASLYLLRFMYAGYKYQHINKETHKIMITGM